MGGGKRQTPHCGICGTGGHRMQTCPENKSRKEAETVPVSRKSDLTAKADEIQISQAIRERVNFLLRDGGGIQAVMEAYDLNRPEAVRLVARVKNVEVPEVEVDEEPDESTSE